MKSLLISFLCLLFVFVKGQNRDVAGNLIVERHRLTSIYKLCYKKPEPQYILRESEVAMANRQWNYIDLSDPLNKKLFNSLNTKDTVYPLIEVLEFGIITQKIACFKNDQFGSSKNKIYSVEEFKNLITSTDTILEGAIDEHTNRDTIIKVAKKTTLNKSTVKGFLLKEEWFFNKKKAVDEVRIIGIAPLMYSEKDQKIIQVYWVYFKECKELLASFKTVNPLGTNESYTYTDLFDKHSFATKATKESNVFERNQPENSKGFNVEIENDKSKQNQQNSARDHWPK